MSAYILVPLSPANTQSAMSDLSIILCNVYSAVPPTIAEATYDTVDTHPMLTAGQVLTLTCSAMGTPHPQIDWYNGDSRITTSSRVQINKNEFGDSTLVSTLVISSVTVGDSGTYECQAENSAGSTSLQWLSVSVCINVLLYTWHCHVCTAYFACVGEHSERESHTQSKLRA